MASTRGEQAFQRRLALACHGGGAELAWCGACARRAGAWSRGWVLPAARRSSSASAPSATTPPLCRQPRATIPTRRTRRSRRMSSRWRARSSRCVCGERERRGASRRERGAWAPLPPSEQGSEREPTGGYTSRLVSCADASGQSPVRECLVWFVCGARGGRRDARSEARRSAGAGERGSERAPPRACSLSLSLSLSRRVVAETSLPDVSTRRLVPF